MAGRSLRRQLAGWLIAGLGFWAAAAGAASGLFIDAQDAYRQGNLAKLEALAPKLKNHVLAPYVDYYRWRLQLERGQATDAGELIARNEGTYLAEEIRAEWLRHLGSTAQWERFEAVWPSLASPDAELRCLALEARRRTPDRLLVDDARKVWRSVVDLPHTCQTLFRSLIDLALFSEADIWERARWQTEAGRYAHARKVLSYLPKGSQVDDRVWAALNNRTTRFLDGILANQTIGARNRELAALALLRLARQEPAEAADYLSRFGARLPAEDRARLWAAVAVQGAIAHQPEASRWFGRVDGVELAAEQHRWAVRAALRAGDWANVRQQIEAMPPALASEPAWIYWLGRAFKAEGKLDLARQQWARIAGQTDYYGLLAAEELDRRFVQPPRAVAPTAAEIAQVAALGSVERALAFFELELRNEGVREWAFALRGMNDRQLLAAAEYAKRQHIYDRAISAAEKTLNEHDYSLRYLTPFDDKVRPAAKAQALDDAWVYGLMRQESRFTTVARSSVGAQGLMQIMPATGRYVAKKLGLRDYHPSRLAQIDTNVMLGTTYLRMVYESLDKHPVLASAAYNAGPGRARKWRDPNRTLEGAIYVETIPFTETRDYVKKVLANAVIYTSLLSGKSDSLKARLGVVKSVADSTPPDEDLP